MSSDLIAKLSKPTTDRARPAGPDLGLTRLAADGAGWNLEPPRLKPDVSHSGDKVIDTIAEAVRQVDEQTARRALLAILEGSSTPAFGSLPKRELDLLLLDALIAVGYLAENADLYTLVRRLRITRSRARGLLYERELRRLNSHSLDALVREALQQPLLQKQGDVFCLEIENPLVADHLRSLLRELGYPTDGSFSPSLVRMSVDAGAALIERFVEAKDREALRKALVAAGAPDKSLRGVLVGVLKKLGSKVAGEAGDALAESSAEFIKPILDVSKGAIKAKMGPLFKSDG